MVTILRRWRRFCRKAIGFFVKPCLSKRLHQVGASDNQPQQEANISMQTVKSTRKVEVLPLHIRQAISLLLGALRRHKANMA